MNDAERWQRIKALLAQALELRTSPQREFIARVSEGDATLHDELTSLAAAARSDKGELDSLPAALALEAVQARTSHAFIGRQLGRYRIVSLIAAGGMGEVYRAERADGQYEQHVALKVMRDGLDQASLVTRFKTERQILASLDHPNLAKVLDGGVTDDGVPYFVMELVAGDPIDAYAERMKLSIAERVQMFRSVCQVVHYAHQKGVVHRDLKVGNILVTHDGVVKLVDFGIAKRIAPDASDMQTRTATAQRVMTLVYSSPEQVRGEVITPASDIYSLGVVLYRLLTKASPYPTVTADNAYELTRAICDTEPSPPSKAAATDPQGKRRLRGDLDAVVMMALRKDPQRRYASAEALSEDLFRHLEGLPVQARRGAWSYRAGRFVLRHRAVVGAAMVANLALIGGIALASYQTWHANLQRERAERHFASVRQLAHVFIFDIHDTIQNLPGSTAARKLVVENAIAYLRALSAEAGGNMALQTEIAAGYRKVGDILGRPYVANLGDPKGAMESYDRAKATLLPLVAAAGQATANRHAARQELARVYQHQGALLDSLARYKEAEAALRSGLAIATELAAVEPIDPSDQMLLASAYGQLGQLQFYSGDMANYLKSSDTAVSLYEAVIARAPGERDAVLRLAVMHDLRGQYLTQRDDSPASGHAALVFFRKGLALLQRLHEETPEQANIVRKLAGEHSNLGATLYRVGDVAGSAEQLRHAIGLLAGLTAKDSRDMDSLGTQALVTGNLSEALRELGDADASVAAAHQAIALFGKLVDGARLDASMQSAMGVARYNLALALDARAAKHTPGSALAQADAREACRRYAEAVEILQALHDRAGIMPGNLHPDTVRKTAQTRRCSRV